MYLGASLSHPREVGIASGPTRCRRAEFSLFQACGTIRYRRNAKMKSCKCVLDHSCPWPFPFIIELGTLLSRCFLFWALGLDFRLWMERWSQWKGLGSDCSSATMLLPQPWASPRERPPLRRGMGALESGWPTFTSVGSLFVGRVHVGRLFKFLSFAF